MPRRPASLFFTAFFAAALASFWLATPPDLRASDRGSRSGQAEANAMPPFAGHWVDRENAGVRMSVREDNGLFRITAGDENYGYTLSCLLEKTGAVCIGSGGRLEGQNFLYRSTFRITGKGHLAESWQAFNTLQSVNGQTIWKRP